MSKREKTTGFFAEFRKFVARGNVMDLAVGVIIGGAFSKITTSLVNDIIMPGFSVLLGGINDINLTGAYRPVCANVVAITRQAMALELPIILGLPLPIAPEDMQRLNQLPPIRDYGEYSVFPVFSGR